MAGGQDALRLLTVGEFEFRDALIEELTRQDHPTTSTAIPASSALFADFEDRVAAGDCVLIHHQPPAVDSLEVLDTLREGCPTLPIVVYTTHADVALAENVLARDYTGYVARDPAAADTAILVSETVLATMAKRLHTDDLRLLLEWSETLDEGLSDAVWEWDVTTDTLSLSDGFTDAFGFTSQDQSLSFDWWLDRVHPNDRPDVRVHKRAIERGEVDQFETLYRFRQANGTYAYVLSRGLVSTDHPDTPHAFGLLIKIEQQIEYLARFHELVEYSVDTISIVGADGTVNYVSPSVEHLTGRTADTVIGGTILEYVHPEDRALVTETVEGLVDGSNDVAGPIEYRIGNGDGEWVWVESVLRAPATNLHIDGFLVNTRDITDRKTHEAELRRFQLAVEQAGTAIYITDVDGTIEYVNPAFEEITGYSAADAIGATPTILKSDEQDPAYYRRLWGTITDGDVWEELIVNRTTTGERYTAVQTIAPIQTPREGITGYVALQNDITDQELNRQRLEVLNRVLRHNLRNSLTVISGHVDVLAEAAADTPDAEASVAAIRKTVDRLLAQSEKAREIQEILQQELYAAESVEAVLDHLEEVAATYPAAQVVFDPIAVEATNVPAIIERALREILENAIRHTDRDPEVTVSVHSTGDADVVFTIADNGPGLPELEQQVLADGREDQLSHSQGVGLWMAYWLVQLSGGRIHFEENQPRGTVVTVSVPRQH